MIGAAQIESLYAETEEVINKMASVAVPYMVGFEENVGSPVFRAVYALWHCCIMTSDTILKLCQLNKIWDAVILLRSVIHGTAKFAYLLSGGKDALEERHDEYHVIIPKKEFASMEKPTELLFKIGAYGSQEKESFVDTQFRKVIKENKTRDGEGPRVRSVAAQWDFYHLSDALKSENSIWKELFPDIEHAYASSNVLVHMNDTGCGEIMQRLSYEPGYQQLMDAGHAASLMFRLVELQLVRSHAITRHVGGETHTLTGILLGRKDYADLLARINDEVCEAVMKYEGSKT